MERHLGWCRNEFHELLQAKEKNQQELDEVNEKTAEIESEQQYKKDGIKAQKRQNKLLAIALSKVQAQIANTKAESMQI